LELKLIVSCLVALSELIDKFANWHGVSREHIPISGPSMIRSERGRRFPERDFTGAWMKRAIVPECAVVCSQTLRIALPLPTPQELLLIGNHRSTPESGKISAEFL